MMMMPTAATSDTVMTDNEAAGSFAAQRRRESRRQEYRQQERLAEMMARHIDPKTTFWSSLENAPRSRLSGLFQKRRGVRSGLPDLMVISRGKPTIFVELKAPTGALSKVQKAVRLELLQAGASYYLARTARAAMAALVCAGIVLRRKWKPRRLRDWEGPFATTQRLPQEPTVAAQRRAAQRAWRERHKRARATAKLAAGRDDAAGSDIAAPDLT
jgi:hypothetical protein